MKIIGERLHAHNDQTMHLEMSVAKSHLDFDQSLCGCYCSFFVGPVPVALESHGRRGLRVTQAIHIVGRPFA
jgi:hypothetical protein